MPSTTKASPIQIWAVDHESVQITWGWLPAGVIRVTSDHDEQTIDHRGGPGAALLMHPSGQTQATVRVISGDGSQQLTTPIPVKPPGELLTRVATISDLHLGARRWGFFKTMREATEGQPAAQQPAAKPGEPPGPYEVPHPMRCARSAVEDLKAWGARLLVFKGDVANHEHKVCFDQANQLIDAFPALPMLAIPGNHDVDEGGDVTPEHFGQRQLPVIRGVEAHDVPGLRLILADSTIPGRGRGSLDRIGDQIIDIATESDRPIMLLMHHHLQPGKVARHWPVGITAPESTEFLDRLDRLDQSVIVSSGHTHRNRARMHGSVLITEVGSTKDWPGVWAGYNVFEGGIEQLVRRVSAPTAMAWTEYSRYAVGGLWARWSPGKLDDRCLSESWGKRRNLVG